MTQDEQQDIVSKVLDFSDQIPGVRPNIKPLDRAIRMIRAPESVWPDVLREPGNVVDALIPYTLMVGLVPMIVGGTLGSSLGALLTLFGGFGMHPTRMVFMALVDYVYTVISILGLSKVLELAAPSLDLRKSLVLSTRVMVYGSTPVLLVHLVGWIPLIGWLAELVALWWSVRLVIQGSKVVLKLKQNAEPSMVPDAPVRELALR